MGEILKTAAEFFAARSWTATPMWGGTVLKLSFDTGRARWLSYAQEKPEKRLFLFYSVSPKNAPEERRMEVAEFLTRASWGLHVGAFEMDWSDGEIRFKSSLDLRGEKITPQLVEGVVEPNLVAANQYLPHLLAVMRGEQPAAQAAEEADKYGR